MFSATEPKRIVKIVDNPFFSVILGVSSETDIKMTIFSESGIMRKLRLLCKGVAPVLFVLGTTSVNTSSTLADPPPAVTPTTPQPTAAPQPPQNPAASPQTKPVAVDYYELANKKISISVEDGDTMAYCKAIGHALSPAPITIEGHGGRNFSVTLKVTDMPLGDVLKAVAAFGGGQLYIFPDHFLISPPDRLTPAEKTLLSDQH